MHRRHLYPVTRNLGSHIDVHTHAGSTFHNAVTLTFDPFSSASTRAEVLPPSICVLRLVSIAQASFLLERGPSHRLTPKVTDATDHSPHA